MSKKTPNQIIENGEVIFELKPLERTRKYIAVEYIIIPIVAVFILLFDKGHILILLSGLIQKIIIGFLSLFM